MAQDKSPKRGWRWPVVDNPHRSRLTCCPSHSWSFTARVAHQGRYRNLIITITIRSCGWGGSDLPPQKKNYVGRVRVCFDPIKLSHSFIQNCCCITLQVSQHQGWTVGHYHFTDTAYADDATILISDQLQLSRQCHPINAFAAILGFKLSWPKTKLQNVGAGGPPSTILIDGVAYQLKE